MITKEGKARWIYLCTPCGVERFAPDQLRILEAQNRHVRGLSHLQNVMVEAFKPLVEYVQNAISAAESVQSNFELMPPPNTPYEPALRKDRRKWGGR